MRFFPTACVTGLLLLGAASGNAADESNQQDSVQPTVVVRTTTGVGFDLAKSQSQARIVSVSSGAIAFAARMIDNDPKTAYRFSGNDLHPTVVLELSGQEPVHRVSSVFQSDENATLEVYLLTELPKTFAHLSGTPVSCVADPVHPNEAKVDFTETNVRYLVFRWTRNQPSHNPFWVAELSAFGSVSTEPTAPFLSENGMHFPNESKIDFSNSLGVIADPPSVALTSP